MDNNKSLGSKARSGLGWNLFGNFLKQFFTVVVSILIARILGPEDYGVVAIALIFVSFSQIFVDVGFTEGIIQKQGISDVALSSVFYFNLVVSSVLAVLIYFLAPAIGHYFENERVIEVIEYLVLILPIAALGKVHSAILTKEIRFKSLSIRDIFSALIGGAIGIFAAYSGFGVYSLVWQQIGATLSATILLWIGSKWLPKFEFSWQELKELLSFSTFVFFDTLLQQVFNKLDTIFVGKAFSPTILGLYARADSLRGLINDFSTNSLSKIIYPIFSLLQSDLEKFKSVFVKSVGAIIVLSCFLCGLLFFSAEFIIITLLGEKWRQSIVFFQILIFSTISLPLRAVIFKAILGMGYSRIKFKLGLMNNLLKIGSIPVGYYFGIEAFAWMVVAGRYVIVLVSWRVFYSLVKFNIVEVLKPILLPIAVLFFWTIFYYMKIIDLNMLWYLLPFLLTFFTLLIITKNFGLQFITNEVKGLNKRRKKKKIQ